MFNIPLIPYYSTKIVSDLSVDDIIKNLNQCVEPELKWNTSYLFNGKVTPKGFSIVRNIKGRDSYLPLIKGVFNTENAVTNVQISMSLQPSVIIILVVFALIAVPGLINSGSATILLIIAGAFLFHAFMYVSFLFEVQKAERLLKSILKSD